MRSLILLVIFIGMAGGVDAVVYDGRYRRELLVAASYQGHRFADDVRQRIAKQIR